MSIGREASSGYTSPWLVGQQGQPTSRACSAQHTQQLALVLHQNEQVVAQAQWEVAADHPAGRGWGKQR